MEYSNSFDNLLEVDNSEGDGRMKWKKKKKTLLNGETNSDKRGYNWAVISGKYSEELGSNLI